MKKKKPFYKNSYCDEMTTESDFSPRPFSMGKVKVTPKPAPFNLEIKSSGGTLKCSYDPLPMITEVSKFFDWMHRPPTSYIAEYMENNNCTEKKAIKAVTARYKKAMEMSVSNTCNYIEAEMEEYLYGALWLFLDEAVRRTMVLAHDKAFYIHPLGGLIEELIKTHQELLRNRLSLSIQGGPRKPRHKWTTDDYKNLGKLYKQKQPFWKAASSKMKEDIANWRAEIKKNDPLIPDELLDRLASSEPYVSSPSEVALQHAAFMIGIKIGTYTGRRLREYMGRKPKAWRQKGFRRVEVLV